MNTYIVDILIKEAKKAFSRGEVPIGCIITRNGKIIAKAYNNKQKKHRVINHAEILAIIKASKKIKDWRLDDCDLYVTLEPCAMCKEVIKQSRIKNVYFLLESSFNNEDKKVINYQKMDINNEIYKNILKKFFKMKR